MKKLIISIYLFFRRIVAGLGFSEIELLRNLNFLLEDWLRGRERKEFIERKGLRFYLDPRGSLDEWFHEYEPQTTRFMEDALEPGMMFVDVGASIGWFSLIASRKVGSLGKVYAFEAGPESMKILRRNRDYNACDNVMVYQVAVSNYNGKGKFYVTGDQYTGGNTVDPRLDPEHKIVPHFRKSEDTMVHEYDVEYIMLDSVVSEASLVKIDVEGAQSAVLRGMRNLLRVSKPTLIIEHPTPEDEDFLKDLGYQKVAFLDRLNAVFV